MKLACALRGWRVEHDTKKGTYTVSNMRTGEHTEEFANLILCRKWMRENLEETLATALSEMTNNLR